ncbi:hypothetical protein N7530_004677 [Penicillium desertorum]|uniref:Uncharacterized protein n=1 Tax=Penicillium desertorum TaxID=1303715 RepID=A0A9X0BQS1_9EURO|nr:hypothetical protein N7530_004677 [Penicillium desertorum]
MQHDFPLLNPVSPPALVILLIPCLTMSGFPAILVSISLSTHTTCLELKFYFALRQWLDWLVLKSRKA